MVAVTLVEDDPRILVALSRALAERGYDVRTASDGLSGLSDIVDRRPDVVVLDLGLPDIDGLHLLQMLRAVSQVPVIVATARDDEAEIIRTLDAGADDYLVKPFSAEQLEARIRAVLRRTGGGDSHEETVVVGELTLDAGTRQAALDGRVLELSR